MPEPKHVSAAILRSLLDAMRSPEWHGTLDDEARAWILLLALADALHLLSPVHIPARRQILDRARRLERDRRIRDEFNGRNYAALAERYHLTTRQIRRITRRRPRSWRRRDGRKCEDGARDSAKN